MDNYYEQLLTMPKNGKYKAVNLAFYIFGAIGLLFLMSFLVIPAALLILLAVGAFFLKKKIFVEYEYDFTNGEIDIDKIIEMKKRSRMLTFDVKEIELLAPEDSYYIKDFSNKPENIVKYYPESAKGKVYVAMITGGTKRVQLKFIPDETFLGLCHKYNPRAVKNI